MSTSTADRLACEPRIAFALAGGAALGAMQAGMVHALYERGIAPDLLIGTSPAPCTPLATGVVEGACRHLIGDRLAIAGSR